MGGFNILALGKVAVQNGVRAKLHVVKVVIAYTSHNR